jgi:hypothetical protein
MPKLASDDSIGTSRGAGQLQFSQFTDERLQKTPSTSGSDTPCGKMAASFYSMSMARHESRSIPNFTRATLKTQTENYFQFAVAIFKNGRWPLRT